MNDPIRVGIVGGAGYTAGELCRLLLNHPEAEIVFVNSESNAGNRLTDVHAGLYGETDLCFTDRLPMDEVDVLFFCFGHGKSTRFLEEPYVPAGAQHVANPGCFATCIQLGLLPLAQAGALEGDISVNAITGSTGAGVKPASTTHFSWRSGNMSIYKAFNHQHVPEIRQSLCRLQPEFDGSIDFSPYRGDFPRGIFATEVVRCDLPLEEVVQLYKDFYAEAPFTHYVDGPIDMKQVVNTNKCLVHVDKHGDKLLITSCIDNLLKGASGQAVQNMNLRFGLEESTGLRLKPLAF